MQNASEELANQASSMSVHPLPPIRPRMQQHEVATDIEQGLRGIRNEIDPNENNSNFSRAAISGTGTTPGTTRTRVPTRVVSVGVDELKERVNARATAYGSLAVISALLFGFSVSICYSAIIGASTSNYGAAVVLLSNLAASSSMLSTITFTYYYYFALRLMADRGPREAQTFFDKATGGLKEVKAAARYGIIISLATLVMSLAVLGFKTLETWLAICNATFFLFSLLLSLVLGFVEMKHYFQIRNGIGLDENLSANGIRLSEFEM